MPVFRAIRLMIFVFPMAALATSDEAWLEDDVEAHARAVNEGELEFLTQAPATIHHHENRITVYEQSLTDGWVLLHQCHENLDRVPRAQIVFNEVRTRKLTVLDHANIERVWIEGPTVQLEDIETHAKLCIQAESQALSREGEGRYVLTNGPFMRRFLDGYYPMHVSIKVAIEPKDLQYVGMTPDEQAGLKINRSADTVEVDALFEGRLQTRLFFEKNQKRD